MINIHTHRVIDRELCGTPLCVGEGSSQVQLETTPKMVVDESGLVHGGFIFGLADYSAMIAVNHPHVVLGSAEVKFLKPVNVHDVVVAGATVTRTEGRKHVVSVTVERGDVKVFEGEFICFVLDKPVLS